MLKAKIISLILFASILFNRLFNLNSSVPIPCIADNAPPATPPNAPPIAAVGPCPNSNGKPPPIIPLPIPDVIPRVKALRLSALAVLSFAIANLFSASISCCETLSFASLSVNPSFNLNCPFINYV